jgi:hypothetical protein
MSSHSMLVLTNAGTSTVDSIAGPRQGDRPPRQRQPRDGPAALQLSAQKWSTFTVHGDEQFRRLCVELGLT